MTPPVVSVAIMHVPGAGRDAHVAELVRLLPSDWSVVVVEDPQREGVWPTAQRAWAARTPESSHHLVLSDDAVICDHFGALLLSAIDARPDAVMSLCTRARAPVDAAVMGRLSWLHSADTVYGQAIVVPSAHVSEMLDWVERCVKEGYEHDDGRVGMWARATQRGIYTPVPQLVRHKEGPSLMGHPAARGLGTPLFAADRSDVNWDTEALEVAGSCFGASGLRADAPDELARAIARTVPLRAGRSGEGQIPSRQSFEELRRRLRGGV